MSSYLVRIKELVNTIRYSNNGYKEDDIEVVERAVDSIFNYYYISYRNKIHTPIVYAKYEGNELVNLLTDINKSEINAHKSAVDGCKMINRLCRLYDVDLICTESTDNDEINKFVGEFVLDVYNSEI